MTEIAFWVGPIMNAFTAIRNYIYPAHGLNEGNVEISKKAFAAVEPHVLDTPRRQKAQYLSLLAVDPILQGQGLGQMLLEHDLRRVDEEDSAVWLVSLANLEKFYSRHGFAETVKVEMEGLENWKGGMAMLRD
jgi:GNAT superfamily N-acetyltransferase